MTTRKKRQTIADENIHEPKLHLKKSKNRQQNGFEVFLKS
jgi:hypothetical protein